MAGNVKTMATLLKEFDEREAVRHIGYAIKMVSPLTPCNIAYANLGRHLAELAARQGYAAITPDKIEVRMQSFDYNHAIGVMARVRLEKDPNASAILYIAAAHEMIAEEHKKTIDRLSATIRSVRRCRKLSSVKRKLAKISA